MRHPTSPQASRALHAHRTLVRSAASALALGAVLVFGAATASAQHFEQGLGDPRIISPAGLGPSYSGLTGAGVGLLSNKPKYGISAGDFIIQPRLFLEGAYSTNFFRVDNKQDGQEVQGVFVTHVRPGVALFNPLYDKVAVSLGVDGDIFLPLTGGDSATDQTNVGGRARLAVALFPKSALTLTLNEQFTRTIWMRPTVAQNANRNSNSVGADLSFHPGGRALDFTVGYAYDIARYDDLDELATDAHALKFLASWRFYPQTYAFLEATARFSEYKQKANDAEEARPGNFVPGTPVKAYLGLSGYFTERLAILARAGYGTSMLDRGQDFSSAIGQLQLSYRFSEKTVLHVGGVRDFEMAPLGGYMEFVRAYATFTQRIGNLAELNVDFGYDVRTYGEWAPAPTGDFAPVVSDSTRDEDFIRAGVLLDFDISRLFGMTLGYRYEGILSDFKITTNGVANTVAYDNHRIFTSLNLRY